MEPSQLQVATFDVSRGCHSQPMHTWSWHLSVRTMRVVFQSKMKSLPSPSPDMRKRPSGEKLTWQA